MTTHGHNQLLHCSCPVVHTLQQNDHGARGGVLEHVREGSDEISNGGDGVLGEVSLQRSKELVNDLVGMTHG